MANEFMCPDCREVVSKGHRAGCPQLTGEWMRSASCKGDEARKGVATAIVALIFQSGDRDLIEYATHGNYTGDILMSRIGDECTRQIAALLEACLND